MKSGDIKMDETLLENMLYIVRHGVLSEMDAFDAQNLTTELCQVLQLKKPIELSFTELENGAVKINQMKKAPASAVDLCKLLIALYCLSYAQADFDLENPHKPVVWCPFLEVVAAYQQGFNNLKYCALNLTEASNLLVNAIYQQKTAH